jgi:hypothetical protein
MSSSNINEQDESENDDIINEEEHDYNIEMSDSSSLKNNEDDLENDDIESEIEESVEYTEVSDKK